MVNVEAEIQKSVDIAAHPEEEEQIPEGEVVTEDLTIMTREEEDHRAETEMVGTDEDMDDNEVENAKGRPWTSLLEDCILLHFGGLSCLDGLVCKIDCINITTLL